MTTDKAPERVTAEKLNELWEEFEASAKPTSFDGDMEFFNIEDMQDQAYYLYEAAKSLLEPADVMADPRVRALVEALIVMLDHSGVADAGPDMKDPEDHAAERQARAALAAFEEGGKDDA